MNFPTKFVRTINSLNKDANVRVLVNGFRTGKVPINKGVRQGDSLSLYLFLLAVEPLVATINNDTRIEGLGKGRKRNVKCPSHADDLTLTLVGSPSVGIAFEIIERFSEATGLKLNMEKTQGMMVGSSYTDDRLPPINWRNESIKILGFRIGNANPRAVWHDSLEGLRKQKLLINVPFQTWQAKSLLAKSKLLPQIIYNAHAYPLDTTTRNMIETEFLNYLTNNPTISLSMRSLKRPINDGGIKFPNPITYCDLFLMLPFLDVNVTINNAGEIETSVWRKSTNTGLMLNFSAACPKFWKTGLISYLMHRAKINCSSQTVFNTEVTKLKRLVFANHYPAWFFDTVLTNFKNHNNKISDESSVEVERLPLFLPYFGQASIQFAKSLKRLCRKKFDVKILPIYQTVKVSKYFQLKSATPKALCSNIVYQFSCACDAHVSYIGMSSRHLSTRAKEHLNLADSRKSAIKDHLYSCDICSNNLDMDSFTILKKCNSEYET